VALGPEIRRRKATRRTAAPAIHRRRPQCKGQNTGTQGTVRARHMARRHAAGWSSVQRAKDAARRLVPESALRCGLGWLRCGVTTWAVRCELRSCGNDDAPAHGGSKARFRRGQGKLTVQEKGRLQCSQRGGGVVVAGLTKMVAQRGRTRRLPAPCSASASPPDATSFSYRGGRSGSSRPRAVPSSGASAAMRRLASPSPPPLLPLPLFSFPRGGTLRKGENPQVSLGLREGLDLWVIGARSKRRRGKDTVRAPVGWCGGGSEVAARQWMAPSL
jgi:hypothetical protein